MKTLLLYWTYTGNTDTVAKTIYNTVKEQNYPCDLFKIGSELEVDWFNYNLVFAGSPVYRFLPPENVMKYLQDKSYHYYEKGHMKPCSPKLKGKLGLWPSAFMLVLIPAFMRQSRQ